MAADYHLTRIGIEHNGMLIDCGANVGELGIWARQEYLEYIPFEPEPLDATCCELNNQGVSTRRYALWSETKALPFYSVPDTADSSLIFMGGTPQTMTVEAVTLDSVIDIAHLSEVPGTVILKVEAEGAEPEVLQGARETLACVDYVTVDCGQERGVQKAHTLVEVANIMADHGFRLRELQVHWMTALFDRAIPKKRRQVCRPPAMQEV